MCVHVCVCVLVKCVARSTAYIQTATDRHYVAVSHTQREGERGAGRERTSLLVIQLMDYVLFKWHLFSSAKTTLKPPFFVSCNIFHQSWSKNKMQPTMNTLRGRAEDELDVDQEDRKSTNPLEPGGQRLTSCCWSRKGEADRWKTSLSRHILF